jgi:hypothetical protein
MTMERKMINLSRRQKALRCWANPKKNPAYLEQMRQSWTKEGNEKLQISRDRRQLINGGLRYIKILSSKLYIIRREKRRDWWEVEMYFSSYRKRHRPKNEYYLK